MTDRQRVYNEVLKAIKKLMTNHKQGHIVTLAMMITGIVISKKARLSVMSSEVPHPAKDMSIEKRMHRFVKNEYVEESTYYMPFASAILSALSSAPLVLAMDGSQVGRGCMALVVGVIYKRRALPIAWTVYKGKKGHTTAARHIEALDRVKPLIPENSEVILLGDGEYDNVKMLKWIEKNTAWQFVVRTGKGSILINKGETFPIGSVSVERGQKISVSKACFTKQAYGCLLAVAWWGKNYEEPIYLISNLENAVRACNYYKKRYRIETFFSDQKSRGFHINKSHISDPDRVARLLLSACIAFIWMIYLGIEVISQNLTHLIDRQHRRDKSIFRLGMDWLKYLLKIGKPIRSTFILTPNIMDI